ncbi:MAG: decarboxylating NADP(+)-dependent phosphogluconate dehydrogenase [Desulfobulbaceae bacterium]|nr:decarboxylating NADP(+)-dependent phosphogluconate dehydrogenase [Desulfobulbaceae bacterium]
MQTKARIAIVGLAVMGENLALNIVDKGFPIAVYNRSSAAVDRFITGRAKEKVVIPCYTVAELTAALERPRKIMLMIKAGAPVDQFIEQLLPYLEPGDIIIDGGNSSYHDTIRRVNYLEAKGIHFIGTGVSGGEEGALNGPSLMPGGTVAAWPALEPIFTAIAAKAPDGQPCCAWMGRGGAGHFVKMVHNGIEYGDMQLICEIYHLMQDVLGMSVDAMHEAFRGWNKGELESYLVEITANIMKFKDEDASPLLEKILDTAGQKGTGKWTVQAALDEGEPLSLIAESVFARFISAQKDLRLEAAKILTIPKTVSREDEQLLVSLEQALYCAKIISYAQGFSLLRSASENHGWQLDYAAVAKIWRGGCIIRSAFLDDIAGAYQAEPELASMLFAPYFANKLKSGQAHLRRTVVLATEHGIPVPCLSAGLSYFDSLRSVRLPANLLQAQRDYFGAHTYERVDKPRGEFFHTNWTGASGNTTSSNYSS